MWFWKKLNNRARILVLLLASLVLLNTIVLVTTHSLRSFSGSFASMLNDRLVPSTDITKMQEFVYQNRLFLEHLIFRDDDGSLQIRMDENDRLLDKTYQKFTQTYFTDEEERHASSFLQALKLYRKDEQEILQYLEEGQQELAEKLYEGDSKEAFQLMINELHFLSGIQLSVGKLLFEHSEGKIQLIRLVAYVSLGISLIVAAQTLKVLGINPR